LHIRLARGLERLGVAEGASALSVTGALMTAWLEAVVLSPYWDSAKPPVLSIYFGHTRAAGAPDPASLWRVLGTLAAAAAAFWQDANPYEASVRRAFTRPLSQAQ